VLAASEGFWLPEPPIDGWSWATLEEIVDDRDFDDLIEAVAKEADSAALGFAVFDGNSSYLAAASPQGIEARLVFDHEAYDAMYEGQFPPAAETARGGAKAFAVWSSTFAPSGVSAAAIRRFCEEPDPLPLLIRAGLYPPPKPSTRPAWENWHPKDMHGAGPRTWNGGGHSHLEGAREYAVLQEPAVQFEGPPGPWILFVARETLGRQPSAPMKGYLTFTAEDKCYSLRGDFTTIEESRRHFGTEYHGRTIGAWNRIPDSVGRNRADTIAWLLEASVDGDWRLARNQAQLQDVTLVHTPYRTGVKWLKDHCRFCSAAFVDPTASEELARLAGDDPKYQTGGYVSGAEHGDGGDWICEQCFNDFHERFEWRVANPQG
jgi:hypothetical protein